MIDLDAILPLPRDPDIQARDLRRMLADLQREYQARAEPIIRMLVRLEAMRPVPPLMALFGSGIDLDALKAAGLNSRAHSEQLLAEHHDQQAAHPPSGPGGG